MTRDFPATRTEALTRLSAFVPTAGRDYAATRNYDRPGHPHVSTLSPYIRARALTEVEVLQAVLGRYALSSAEKFVQEVFWRTYWKGWLQMRPAVWDGYQAGLVRAWDQVQIQGGLRRDWEAACLGQTGIDCFDHWAHDLTETGYLHNHARMWFASIWIFTLRLPWELGADFFLRHLLDGDPASNTLSWRWVGGLQTRGKTYLARPDNIARYTDGRFNPRGQLASAAPPLDGPPSPDRRPAPVPLAWDTGLPSAFLLTPEDVSPGYILDQGLAPMATAPLWPEAGLTPLRPAPHVKAFHTALMDDAMARYGARLGRIDNLLSDAQALVDWAKSTGASQIVTPFAPVGPTAALLARAAPLLAAQGTPLVQVLRPYDAAAWPHATHGFFRFKDKIPELLRTIGRAAAA